MSTTFNILDLILIAFAIIFVAVGFFRGFIKEFFSLIGWILAFVGSYFLTPYLASVVNVYSDNKILADLLSRSAIFIIIIISYTFAVSNLANDLREKMPRLLDASLGVFYGLIKTLIVFGFLYSAAVNALEFVAGKPVEESSPQFPTFLKEARFHDIMKGSGDILNPAVKLFFDDVVKNFDKTIPKNSDELNEKIEEISKNKAAKTVIEKLSDQKEPEPSQENIGYDKKDIQKMNHLIDIIDKK